MAAWQGLGNCTVGLRQFEYYDQERKQALCTSPVRNGLSWASKAGCRLHSDATAERISNASAGILR